MWCEDAFQSGVPLSEFAHRIPTVRLKKSGRDAAQAKATDLSKKLGVNDVEVDCKYLGVSTPSGLPDLNRQATHDSNLVYEWSLCFGNGEEKEQVKMRYDRGRSRWWSRRYCKNLYLRNRRGQRRKACLLGLAVCAKRAGPT